MKTSTLILSLAAASAAAAFASSTLAGAVGIDGTIGAEWAGANVAHVGYDPGAATSNFGSPSNVNHNVAYDIYTRQDASYIYVGLQTDASLGGPADLFFANLYFGNDAVGSYAGFEVTNDNAFAPGYGGSYNVNSLDGSANEVFWSGTDLGNGLNKTIELAIPWSFFTTNPLGITGDWQPLNPGDTIKLRLSQSFGYSVAGGFASYGADRLGAFTYPVPAPGALALLCAAGLVGARRRRD